MISAFAIGGIPNKVQVGDMGVDGRIFPVSSSAAPRKQQEGELGLKERWYPIQVKQKDRAGRPDIDAFEAMMMREDSRLPICTLCMVWHSSHFQSGLGPAPKLAATASMMDDDSLTELTREIMTQGYDEETASNYAVLIGDTPCMDEAGNVVVMDGNKEIARLKPLKMFETE
jgi:hypothetical protein